MMAEDNWRKDISPEIKAFLEALVEDAHKHKDVYMKSKNPSAAQIWCALASLSKQLFDLNLKLKLLEKVLKDNLEKPSHIKDVPDKKERDDLIRIAANPKKKNL